MSDTSAEDTQLSEQDRVNMQFVQWTCQGNSGRGLTQGDIERAIAFCQMPVRPSFTSLDDFLKQRERLLQQRSHHTWEPATILVSKQQAPDMPEGVQISVQFWHRDPLQWLQQEFGSKGHRGVFALHSKTAHRTVEGQAVRCVVLMLFHWCLVHV